MWRKMICDMTLGIWDSKWKVGGEYKNGCRVLTFLQWMMMSLIHFFNPSGYYSFSSTFRWVLSHNHIDAFSQPKADHN